MAELSLHGNLYDFPVKTLLLSETPEYFKAWKELYYPDFKRVIDANLVNITSFYIDRVKESGEHGFIALRKTEGVWTEGFVRYKPLVEAQPDLLLFDEIDDPSIMNIVCLTPNVGTKLYHPSFGYIFCDETQSFTVSVKLTSLAQEVASDIHDRREKEFMPRNKIEQKLEDELYDWLRVKGVNVERQVSTSKHRLDLWVVGRMMLELKQGRVSGDDVCQAIDYAASYETKIVLVGTGLSTAASRGIEGFNMLSKKGKIVFITWSGVKDYLSGVLNITSAGS